MATHQREIHVLVIQPLFERPCKYLELRAPEVASALLDDEIEALINDVARTGGYADWQGHPKSPDAHFVELARLWIIDRTLIEIKERRMFWFKCKWLASEAKFGMNFY